jgi:class 3 adenylate cyclase/tetratricopeptide (TPR) repeat protein
VGTATGQQICANCGAASALNARFCAACGTALGHRQAGPAQPSKTLRLHPERKFVTILFADLKGSLELIAGLDAEQADALLMRAINKMIDAVHRFGGTVNRIAGDGIMAMFGAPAAEEHHAQQACYAALAILDGMKQHAEEDRIFESIPVRIGLHSGEAVVRQTVTDTSSHYDALGEPVHIAARMEQNAGPNSILLTAQTFHLAEGHVEVRALGPTQIKGLAHTMEVFELLSALPFSTRSLRVRPGGGLARFVNRLSELEILRKAAEGAADGGGQVVSLIGEAGGGKSRLAQQFLATLAGADWLVCKGHALPFGRAGYRIIVDLIHDYFAILPGDSTEALQRKLVAGIDQILGDAAEPRQALLALCGQSATEPAWLALEPSERRRHVADAVCSLFREISRRQKLVLVLEDLHWVDVDSEDLLDMLVDLARNERILVITTQRQDSPPKWQHLGHCRACAIEPLADELAQQLVRSLILPGPNIGSLERHLVARTKGNPLFIEECLSSLADTGALKQEQSGYRLVGSVSDIELPVTLRALLTSRVDRLPELEKSVLQAASVVGPAVPTELVELIVTIAPDRLRVALRRLHEGGFLTPSETGPEGSSYDFRHALTREAVYADMLISSRRDLHARVLTAIEQHYQGRIAEHVEALAEHAIYAEKWQKAADYCRQSARKATFRNSNGEAVRFLDQALSALSRLPDGAETSGAQIDVRLEMRFPLFKLGRTDEVAQHLHHAAPLASDLQDHRRLTLLHTYESHIRWLFGESDAALEAAREAVAAAGAIPDRALGARARFQEGLIWMTRGAYPRAIEAIAGVLDYAEVEYKAGSYPDAAIAVTAQSYLSRIDSELGNFESAQRHLDAAHALAEEIDNTFSRLFVATAAGFLCLCRGEAEAAIPLFERARGIAVAADSRLMIPVPTGFLGMAYAAVGRTDEALRRLNDAVADADGMNHRAGQPVRLAALARACLASGDVAVARSHAKAAADMARVQIEPNGEAAALRAMGEAWLAGTDADGAAARRSIAQALRIADEHGLTPLADECRALLSRIESVAA